jgi:phage-related protein
MATSQDFSDLTEHARISIIKLMDSQPKLVEWIGSALDDLKGFPETVQQSVGYALYRAQCGEKHPSAKPLKGFKGASVLEVIQDFDGDTYRAVYTIKFEEVVYVLHAFQKKSKRGIETSKQDIELIEARLKRAKEHYEQCYKRHSEEDKQ